MIKQKWKKFKLAKVEKLSPFPFKKRLDKACQKKDFACSFGELLHKIWGVSIITHHWHLGKPWASLSKCQFQVKGQSRVEGWPAYGRWARGWGHGGGGRWGWLKPACLCIYHFVPEEVFVQHSSLTAQKHCGQKPYQRTYWHISFVVLVSQGKATSHFICTSIKLYTFLSVQYSLIPFSFLSLKYCKRYFKIPSLFRTPECCFKSHNNLQSI